MSHTDSDTDSVVMVTTRRWLYNNDIQMSLRRLNFDITALGVVAAKVAGASKCSEIEVIAEGSFNRIFRLGLSNGKDVIARIPFPNAGPRSLLTRSEVATMDFVRSRLGVPVPKVLAWDATTDNGVGCEYIIMERCDGSTLENRLDPDSDIPRHVYDVADLMSKLASISFSQYGNIYYKEDVDSHLQERPLYAEGEQADEFSEQFRIGPSVERRFYRGERVHLSVDRGPWKDINSYIEAAVRCEIEWIQSYSDSPQAQNQLGALHSAEQHISLLQKWLSLVPAVLPAPEYCAPTLAHPDLHAGNIFVTDDDPMSVAWIIDWQGAAVRPFFEIEMPQLTADKQQEACKEFRRVWPVQTFFKIVGHLRRPLLAVLRLLQMEYSRRAIYYSSHSWSDGLPLLEQCLIQFSAQYGTSIPVHSDYPVCPVVFSEDDIKRHAKEFREIIFKEEVLDVQMRRMLEHAGLFVHRDGSVEEDNFEAAVKKLEEIFAFCTRGDSEEDVEKTRRCWPMHEGQFVLGMESCI